MLVTEEPQDSKKYAICAWLFFILLFLAPIITFCVLILYYGNWQLAWDEFTQSAYVSTTRPSSYMGVSIIIYVGFLVGSLVMMKRYWWRKKYGDADKTLSIKKVLNNEPYGLIKIKRKNGKGRFGPYVEVFLDGQFLAGLMGHEAVEVRVSPGEYELEYRVSYHADSTVAKQLQKNQKGPLEQQIEKTLISIGSIANTDIPLIGCDYKFSIPVEVSRNEILSYYCLVKNIKNPLSKKNSKAPRMQNMIYCWKSTGCINNKNMFNID